MKAETRGGAGAERATDVAEVRRFLASADALLVRISRAPSEDDRAEPSPVALARWLLDARGSIGQMLNPALFGDPAFDMLLDVFIDEEEGRAVSISSVCAASGVTEMTALRWLNVLQAEGFVSRTPDSDDRGRVLLNLTPSTRGSIREWLRRAGRRFPAMPSIPPD